jgi:hypothetical protein
MATSCPFGPSGRATTASHIQSAVATPGLRVLQDLFTPGKDRAESMAQWLLSLKLSP